MAIFTGAGVAIITPMKENGDVNYDKLGELLDYQINNSTDAIVICGTTGEASTLTHEEHIETIRFTADYVKKRVPVIAGTGSNCTETAIYLSKEAQKAGVDGCLVVTPYYNKTTQKGLIKHYTEVAKSIDLPIIMYNVPGRTGCNIQPETAAKLAKEVDNIVAIKEASGNISQVAKIASLCGDNLHIYSGNDDQIIPILSLGGIGVISVLSNIKPKYTHQMVYDYLDGNTKQALHKQLESISLIETLFCEVNPIPIKYALNIKGYNYGIPRLPLIELSEKNKEILKQKL